MANDKKLSRRDFIKITAISAGAVTFAAGSLNLLDGCSTTSQPGKSFLSSNEKKLIGAIAEQIIPTDEWPGGRDAGVANFIDIQLKGALSRFQPDYQKGLVGLENTCKQKFNNNFEKLSWDTQSSIVKNMETGKLEGEVWKKGYSEYFFELLLSHCMQGFYGSPRHGGNKNFISYKMIGLDEPQIIGENRYGSKI